MINGLEYNFRLIPIWLIKIFQDQNSAAQKIETHAIGKRHKLKIKAFAKKQKASIQYQPSELIANQHYNDDITLDKLTHASENILISDLSKHHNLTQNTTPIIDELAHQPEIDDLFLNFTISEVITWNYEAQIYSIDLQTSVTESIDCNEKQARSITENLNSRLNLFYEILLNFEHQHHPAAKKIYSQTISELTERFTIINHLYLLPNTTHAPNEENT